MTPEVVVGWSPESPLRYKDSGWTVVLVDVIRATTTAVTAVASGHRCYPAASLEDARRLAASVRDPLLAGEIEGRIPRGFHIQNSPVAVARLPRQRGPRDVILLSTSGTLLMSNAMSCDVAYAGCLRNVTAQAEQLVAEGRSVALLGAGSGGAFRLEDQICCALIARHLVQHGFVAGRETAAFLETHAGAGPTDFLESDSVAYLRRTDQGSDLRFILSHVDDLAEVFTLRDGELVAAPAPRRHTTASG
jgi:2-phosphosulfolactate phosphatase